MISKNSLVAVLDKSIILTIKAPNDNANQDPVQCGGGQKWQNPVHVFVEQKLLLLCKANKVSILGVESLQQFMLGLEKSSDTFSHSYGNSLESESPQTNLIPDLPKKPCSHPKVQQLLEN